MTPFELIRREHETLEVTIRALVRLSLASSAIYQQGDGKISNVKYDFYLFLEFLDVVF